MEGKFSGNLTKREGMEKLIPREKEWKERLPEWIGK